MRGFAALAVTQIRLFLREPLAAFFTLAYPLTLLFLFGSIFGNQPNRLFGGLGFADTAVPAYASLLIGTSGILTLTNFVASYREGMIFRRFQATPLGPLAILISLSLVIFLMTLIGFIVLALVGNLVYGVDFPENPGSVLVGFTWASIGLFSMGFALASFLPTARTAQAVAQIVFLPMMFLSGASIPTEFLPQSVRQVAEILPLTHVVDLMRGLWAGDSLLTHAAEAVVLGLIILVGLVVSGKTFRWE